jgi:hypothetical membrane protein
MKKLYPYLGIVGPVIYVLTVIIGGALRPDYSHLYNTISELTVAGAPNLVLMNVLFGLYNLMVAVFGLGAFLDSIVDRSKKFKTAMIMLVVIGCLGLMMDFFPQDQRNATVTTAGMLHITLAGLASLLTMAAILLAGLSFSANTRLKKLAVYSFVSCALIFLSGGLAAAAVANDWRYGGLVERITIGLFIQWLLVVAWFVARLKRTPNR